MGAQSGKSEKVVSESKPPETKAGVASNLSPSDTRYLCDNCVLEIQVGKARYHCWGHPVIDERRESFDICETCYNAGLYEKHGVAKEQLYREIVVAHDVFLQLMNARSIAEALLYDEEYFTLQRDQMINLLCLKGLILIFRIASRQFGTRPVLGERTFDPATNTPGRFAYMTWNETMHRIRCFAIAFKANMPEVQKNDFILMCCQNGVDWVVVDFASILLNHPLVPFPPTVDVSSLAHVLKTTKSRVVCADSETYPKVLEACIEVSKATSYSINIIDFDYLGAVSVEHRHHDVEVLRWSLESLELEGESANTEIEFETARDMQSIFALLPSSGSTGVPKCIIVSEGMKQKDVLTLYPNKGIVGVIDSPLAYSSRLTLFRYMIFGNRIAFSSKDPAYFLDDLYHIRPHSLSRVPRFWMVIKSEHDLKVKRLISKHEISEVEARKRAGKWINKRLGGRIANIGIGGAAVSPELLQFLRQVFPGGVAEGYGITEVGSIYQNNIVLAGVEVKLVDWEEYTSQDLPYPRGEICVKTPTMFSGYFGDPELSNAAIQDGWFHTGDIGMLQTLPLGETRVVLIDRKKHLFKLSQGEFVAPERLEGIFIESSLIQQICIIGDTKEPYLIAVVVPSAEVVQPSTKTNVLEDSYLEELARIGIAAKLRPYEFPRAVILSVPFTSQNEMLTATHKLCRRNILKRFQHEIENIYLSFHAGMDPLIKLGVNVAQSGRSLSAIVNHVLKRDVNLSDDVDFSALGGDSIAAMRFVNIVKEERGIDIPIQLLFRGSGLGSILKQVDKSGAIGGFERTDLALPMERIDWDKEIALPADFPELSKFAVPKDIGAVLLTGATGFLGSYLLKYLFRDTTYKIICIVRGNDCVSRLRQCLDKYGVDNNLIDDARVKILEGDISKDLLGLSATEYDNLSSSVHAIYHCAAFVNFIVPYAGMKKDNVTGTLNFLRFATKSSLKVFHFISSLSVLPPNRSCSERYFLNISHINGLSGYPQSKLVSELLVHEARRRGLPAYIYRPGTISGHSITGHCNPTDYINRLILSMLLSKTFPRNQRDASIDLTPVDYVGEAIVKLSLTNHTLEYIFHLTTTPTSLSSFIEMLQRSGFPLQELPYEEWTTNLKRNESDPLFPLLHKFRNNRIPSAAEYSDMFTRGILGDNIVCPPIVERVAAAYAKFLLAANSN